MAALPPRATVDSVARLGCCESEGGTTEKSTVLQRLGPVVEGLLPCLRAGRHGTWGTATEIDTTLQTSRAEVNPCLRGLLHQGCPPLDSSQPAAHGMGGSCAAMPL